MVVPGDPLAAARRLGARIRGTAFLLHDGSLPDSQRVARFVPHQDPDNHIDIAAMAQDIRTDLQARDLTINAMAMATQDGLKPESPVVDPTGGLADLRAGRVRFCSPEAAFSDPLRCFRAVRFTRRLGFRLEPEAEAMVLAAAPGLKRVSGERIRDELFSMLQAACVAETLALCSRLALLPHLLGPGGPAAIDQTGLQQLDAVENRLNRLASHVDTWLHSMTTPPRRRRELVLWTALLAVTEVVGEASAKRLALSGVERSFLLGALRSRNRATELMRDWPAPGAARLAFYQTARSGAAGAALIAEGSDESRRLLLDEALAREASPPAALLTGDDVIRILSLERGPMVKRWLDALEAARLDGVITDRPGAVEWLRAHGHRGAEPEVE